MMTFVKKNKLYCFFQLFGVITFFSIIFLFTLLSGKSVDNFNYYAITRDCFLIIIISHLFIRKRIKAKLNNNQINFKDYFFPIIVAATLFVVMMTSSKLIFSPFFDHYNEEYEPVTLALSINQFITSTLLFCIWSILYTAITSIRDKKTLSKQLQEQQLSSLMNQVNPHFLFNSLNTIRGMIYEDQDKAAELVTQFSSLFRYNLSLGSKKTTNLVDELRVCQQYLAIEKIRLGERLQVNIDVPVQHYQCKIPAMGLFTLVENAIKHGIAHLQKGGELSITVKLENEQLIIEVGNPYDKNLVKSGTQIGLKNLQKRTYILFSGKGNIMQNTDKSTFKVTLSLPYEVIEGV